MSWPDCFVVVSMHLVTASSSEAANRTTNKIPEHIFPAPVFIPVIFIMVLFASADNDAEGDATSGSLAITMSIMHQYSAGTGANEG